MALAIAACDNEGGAESAGSRGTAVPAAGSDEPTDTLTLGDRAFAFQVTDCDLREVQGPDQGTLLGNGTTEDGTRFTVVVDRTKSRANPIHSVSVNYGSVMSGSGFTAEATRIRSETGWYDSGVGDSPGADEPLIRIERRTVRAHGRFKVDDAGEESVVEGRLEANCPAR